MLGMIAQFNEFVIKEIIICKGGGRYCINFIIKINLKCTVLLQIHNNHSTLLYAEYQTNDLLANYQVSDCGTDIYVYKQFHYTYIAHLEITWTLKLGIRRLGYSSL